MGNPCSNGVREPRSCAFRHTSNRGGQLRLYHTGLPFGCKGRAAFSCHRRVRQFHKGRCCCFPCRYCPRSYRCRAPRFPRPFFSPLEILKITSRSWCRDRRSDRATTMFSSCGSMPGRLQVETRFASSYKRRGHGPFER